MQDVFRYNMPNLLVKSEQGLWRLSMLLSEVKTELPHERLAIDRCTSS